jgi:antitoxin ParD1/3/4
MSKNTSISLGNHFENFMLSKIDSGRYNSVSEVVRAGLRLLENEEKKMEVLKEALELGENSGISEIFDSKKHLQSLHKRHL